MADKSKALSFGAECKASLAGTSVLAVSSSLKATHTWLEPSETGLIGTTKPGKDGRILKKTDVKGNLVIRPGYAQLATILGAYFDTAGGGVYTPSATPTSKTAAVVVDRKDVVKTFAACWLQSLTIRANENEPVDFDFELLGTTEADSGSVAALTPPDAMRMSDLVLTINSNTYYCRGFSWKFTYDLVERFLHSLTRSSVTSRIPRVDLSLNLDQNSDIVADLCALAGTNTTVGAVSLAFTSGANSLTIASLEMTVVNPSTLDDVSGVDAQKYDLNLRAWLKTSESHIATLTVV